MEKKLSLNELKLNIKYQVPVHLLESTHSTNSVACDMARTGAVHGTTVFALHQTGGRGRLGRSFASPAGGGIYMSTILAVPADSNPILLTTAAAVAVCKAIENVCGYNPKIKWVNDIYLDNKKVCGILAEAVNDHKSGKISHVVVGIGINYDAAMIPDNLSAIAGAVEGDYSINLLAAEILNQLLSITENIQPHSFIDDYRKRSLVIGKTVTVYKGGFSESVPGTSARVLDIDENGGLTVLYSCGKQETLFSGEISIRL